jgi:predicted O-methyltransferase YrrM
MYSEARRFLANPYSALEDVLALSVVMARKAEGPILETGSGLTTILMAAATEHMVYCIEHDPGYASQLKIMAQQAGVFNIAVCQQPIKDGWYYLADLAEDPEFPTLFALALVDGPPRYLASRMPFYEHFGQICEVIVADDADDLGYRQAIEDWAKAHDRKVDFIEERVRKLERKAA